MTKPKGFIPGHIESMDPTFMVGKDTRILSYGTPNEGTPTHTQEKSIARGSYHRFAPATTIVVVGVSASGTVLYLVMLPSIGTYRTPHTSR